MQQDSMCLHI